MERGACPLSNAWFAFGSPPSDMGTKLSQRLFWVNFPVNAEAVLIARGFLCEMSWGKHLSLGFNCERHPGGALGALSSSGSLSLPFGVFLDQAVI